MYIVVTRPVEDEKIKKKLEKLKLQVFSYPTILIKKRSLAKKDRKSLRNLNSFDFIVFTSQNGVRYFMEALADLGISAGILQTKNIAVVGPETSLQLKKYHLNADFLPSTFTTRSLAEQMPINKGQKVLLPRADIATPLLRKHLIKRGAEVTSLSIYKTELNKNPNLEFENLLLSGQIAFITFTSSSTVNGFIHGLRDQRTKDAALKCSVLSIGPVTTKTLEHFGFKIIHTSKIHTAEGMLKKLREIYT